MASYKTTGFWSRRAISWESS